jgi:short-subunit dehydrogenase
MSDYYSCALITGASSGLGEEFALQLAHRVDKLVLVARREERLSQIADRIRVKFPRVAVAVFSADLTQVSHREQLIDVLRERNFIPDLVVNNAGLGDYGEFVQSDWSKVESMLRLNIEALTHLSHALLPAMVKRGYGAIINVSSLASLLPIPDFAVYAATKAFVTSFSEALRIEVKEHGISVLAVCPGPVHTEFGIVARERGGSSEMPGKEWFYVPKQQVVAESIRALDRNRARVYPGLKTAAAAFILATLPITILRLAMNSRPRRS